MSRWLINASQVWRIVSRCENESSKINLHLCGSRERSCLFLVLSSQDWQMIIIFACLSRPLSRLQSGREAQGWISQLERSPKKIQTEIILLLFFPLHLSYGRRRCDGRELPEQRNQLTALETFSNSSRNVVPNKHDVTCPNTSPTARVSRYSDDNSLR